MLCGLLNANRVKRRGRGGIPLREDVKLTHIYRL